MVEKLKKKIIVITTGGTIGSILKSNSVSVDLTEKKIAKEIEVAKKKLGYEVEVQSPINKNSEVLGPTDWLDVLYSIDDACKTDCDGIVVTHGTDTLVYTVASALSLSHLWSKKVCFTGAYYSPDHPSSDTSLSLLSSLEFAASEHPASGIFVAFRSNENNSEARILNGFDLKPMGFDESFFSSAYGNVVAQYSPKLGLSNDISIKGVANPKIDSASIPSKNEIVDATKKIACISLYPGIDRDTLRAITKGKDVVVIQLYHSGTGPFGPEYSDVVEHIKEYSESTLFLMGSFPSEHIQTPYDSTRALIGSGGVIYRDVQPHFLYVFSLLSLALGQNRNQIRKQLSDWEV
jgi:L-asparaginase